MAFTFNWAGASVDKIKPRDVLKDWKDIGEGLGKGAGGAQNTILDYEYADLIDGRNQRKEQIAELQNQISGLENRNLELIGMARDAQRRQGILAQRSVELENPQAPAWVPPEGYPFRNWNEEKVEMPPRKNVVFNDGDPFTDDNGIPSTEILMSLFPRRQSRF